MDWPDETRHKKPNKMSVMRRFNTVKNYCLKIEKVTPF